MSIKSILVVVAVSCLVMFAKAQNASLTIGEAFNWQVGDTLIYRGYTWGMYPQNFPGAPPIKKYTYYGFTGFEVLTKETASDTLKYTIHFFDRDTSNIMFVLNPDSSVYNLRYLSVLDDAMYPCSFNDIIYNSCVPSCNESIDSINLVIGNPVVWINNSSWLDVILSIQVVKNIGVRWIERVGRGSGDQPGGCGAALAYYKSDSIEWRDEEVYNWVGVNEASNEPPISVYPNPVSDVLYIDSEEPIGKLEVYNLSGQMVLAVQPLASEVNVSLLPAGSYTINVETPSQNIVWRRFIKL